MIVVSHFVDYELSVNLRLLSIGVNVFKFLEIISLVKQTKIKTPELYLVIDILASLKL